LQPLSSKTQKDAINNRLDFVELLMANSEGFFKLSRTLPQCPDLEHIVASCLVQIPKYGTMCGSAEKCQTLITKILGNLTSLRVATPASSS
jgi:DNA mismatch repair ATPase MutS